MTAGSSVALRQKISDSVKMTTHLYFNNAFPGVKDLEKIVLALIYTESGFNVNATKNSGSIDKDFTASSAYSKVLSSALPDAINNMSNASLMVYGLGQVRGSYLVKGGSRSGKCEVERIRPDIGALICVNPGVSVASKMLGEDNITNAVLALMTILQGKFNSIPSIMKPTAGGYSYRGKIFPSRIEAAVGAYLGLGAMDSNRTTPTGYAESIVRGKSYAIANNSSLPATQTYSNPSATQVASGPSTNSSDMAKEGIVGCG